MGRKDGGQWTRWVVAVMLACACSGAVAVVHADDCDDMKGRQVSDAFDKYMLCLDDPWAYAAYWVSFGYYDACRNQRDEQLDWIMRVYAGCRIANGGGVPQCPSSGPCNAAWERPKTAPWFDRVLAL